MTIGPPVPLIRLAQVRALYVLPDGVSTTALDGVDLDIEQGEWVAIVGANGSGKSTLVKLVCGLLQPDEGMVAVQGLSTGERANLPVIRRRLGMVWQEPDDQIVASVVEEEVAFGLEIRQMDPATMHDRVAQTLVQAGLWDERKRLPHQLSGGQRQRLALAAALAPDPDCLVLDEATSMIDEAGKEAITSWLCALHASGKAILSVTHDMREAVLAQRVIVLSQGKVVAQGSPRDVFAHGSRLREWGLTPPNPVDVSLCVKELYESFPAPAMTVKEVLDAFDSVAGSGQGACVQTPWELRTGTVPQVVLQAQPRTKDEAPLVSLRAVNYVYQLDTPFARQALYDVNLNVMRGERLAIVGHTGSGKSTLMQLFSGLLLAEKGQVTLAGLDPWERNERLLVRRKVGLLFQNPERQLFERYVGDDIGFGPLRQGLTLEQARERVRAAMAAVKLPWEWKDRPIHALSGGQKRRVGVAGVLALEPEVLVLDEPTAGLDPASAEELLGFLHDYQTSRGVPIILVTHRLQEAALFAERIIVMDSGRIVQEGPASEVLQAARIASWGFPVPDFISLSDGFRQRGVAVAHAPPHVKQAAAAIACALHEHTGGHVDESAI